MLTLLWDASALVKRYVEENGTDTVETLFAGARRVRMALTIPGYAETYSVLLRRRNAGLISDRSFEEAIAALRNDSVFNPRMDLVSVDAISVFASIETMRRHNLNSTDAAILTAFAGYVREYNEHTALLIASDLRLLRAAEAEGLATLNPETVSPEEAAAMITRE